MLQALKIPDAKAAVEKEWEKLEKILAWQLTKVRNKKEVIDEVRNQCRKVHFASLMDLCHLKNSGLEPQDQKYKGRVVLRSDIVKDDSGSYAEFTEQRSPASQMTAAKVMDIISRLPGQAADAISAYTPGQNGRCTIIVQNSKWPKSWSSMEDPVVPLERKYVRSSFGKTLKGKAIRESSSGKRMGKSSKLGMVIR